MVGQDKATIRIKCPNCGAILTVVDSPSNERKSVRCPVCKERNRFIDFKLVFPGNDDADKTNLGVSINADDKTQLPSVHVTASAGYLIEEESHKRYALLPGVNLIGRKTYKTVSAATVPIETNDLGFSRKHLFIEAVKGPDGVTRYYAYNAANKNETTVNGVVLSAEDKIILHNSDRIHSSETTLVFRVSDQISPNSSNDSDRTQI